MGRVDRKLDNLYDRIGWQREDMGGNGDAKSKKLLRWLPDAKSDEFIYDLERAPVGHLPLTSTLRDRPSGAACVFRRATQSYIYRADPRSLMVKAARALPGAQI